MIKHFPLALVLCLLYFPSYSIVASPSSTQGKSPKKDYEAGYVVLHSGDTIRGWVRDRKTDRVFIRLDKAIRFIAAGRRRKKKYSPEDIQAYGKGSLHFQSKWYQSPQNIGKIFKGVIYNNPGQGDCKFMRLDHLGPLSIYTLEVETYDNGIEERHYFKLASRDYFIQSETLLGLRKKQLLQYLVQPCPALEAQLQRGLIKDRYSVVEFYDTHCL